MDLQLNGRIALVSGGSSGIGKAIALTLAREGADIIICSRDRTKRERAEREIRSKGVMAFGINVDVTDKNDVKNLFAGPIPCPCPNRLDILVNNVGGVEKFGEFSDLTDEDWEHSMNLNFHSMRWFCKYALPFLKCSYAPRILNICTVPAHQPGFFNPHYGAAKAAMLNLSKHLANIWGKFGILVNAVCPSTIQGGAWKRNVKNRADRQSLTLEDAERRMLGEAAKKSPLGKVGLPEDVANLVAFLVSPLNRFITGACINIDGGITRAIS